MGTNNRIKKFYTKIWNDTWSWVKPLIIVVAWIHVAAVVVVCITYTGIILTDWLTEDLRSASGGTIISWDSFRILMLTAIYLIWKYLISTWKNTKEDNKNGEDV